MLTDEDRRARLEGLRDLVVTAVAGHPELRVWIAPLGDVLRLFVERGADRRRSRYLRACPVEPNPSGDLAIFLADGTTESEGNEIGRSADVIDSVTRWMIGGHGLDTLRAARRARP